MKDDRAARICAEGEESIGEKNDEDSGKRDYVTNTVGWIDRMF